MIDYRQPEFKAIELDQEILSQPFKIHTNWHVITGSPSCGKTTLINSLTELGYKTAQEGARLYMEQEIARGRSVDEIHSDVTIVQRGIKDKQFDLERELDPTELIFLDRALPDTLAWYRIFGLNPNEFLCDCFQFRYASVFILDTLPLDLDSLRFNDEVMIGFCDEWHTKDYQALGYQLIRVPVLSPKERALFVLDNL
jgi:predicted ATPase